MSGKVICTELILRVQAELLQIFGPGGHCLPMLCCIFGIAGIMADCSRKRKHVPSLLDRHVTAIGLTVGDRIGSYIMGRERLGPLAALTVIIDMVHEAFCQRRVIQQEQRR